MRAIFFFPINGRIYIGVPADEISQRYIQGGANRMLGFSGIDFPRIVCYNK